MARNYNYDMYDYGTSPRKLQPEYTPNRQKKNKNIPQQRQQNKENKQNKAKQKEKQKEKKKLKNKQQRKIIAYIVIGFSILFVISYRNSKIDEQFSDIQKQKANLVTLQKENEQLQVNIENGSNLNSLEQSAKELLGMQKLTSKQSVYVSLPKVDYIEGN